MAPNNRPQLEQLWASLAAFLQDSFKTPKRPSVEMLAVTRRFLRENKQGATNGKDRKQLEQLCTLYSLRLAEALAAEHVTASMLAEGRKWLELHGIRVDLSTAEAAQVAKKLGDGSLPFTHDNTSTHH